MTLQFGATHSSRITKRKTTGKPASVSRTTSTPAFGHYARVKPLSRSSTEVDDDEFFLDRLDDQGLVHSLATDLELRDVAQLMRNAQTHMFDRLPSNAGFNSVRISEILNFRKALPPLTTTNHLRALMRSATALEREIAQLSRAGVLHRIRIPGRGVGGSGLGDSVALLSDLQAMVERLPLEESSKHRYQDILSCPRPESRKLHDVRPMDITEWMNVGLMTRAPELQSASLGSSAISIEFASRAASGSLGAAGGATAIYDAGGRGGFRKSAVQEMQISAPNMGQYLRLVTAARSHIVDMLTRTRHHEMPEYILRERWDGDSQLRPCRYKSQLPARMRKWKEFHGLAFDWILAECLGAGLVEVFETGSVGRGVRARPKH